MGADPTGLSADVLSVLERAVEVIVTIFIAVVTAAWTIRGKLGEYRTNTEARKSSKDVYEYIDRKVGELNNQKNESTNDLHELIEKKITELRELMDKKINETNLAIDSALNMRGDAIGALRQKVNDDVSELLAKINQVELKLSPVALKAETSWEFIMNRARIEAKERGFMQQNSPLTLTEKGAEIIAPVLPIIKEFLNLHPDLKKTSQSQIEIKLASEFGEMISREVCEPNDIYMGACVVMLMEALRLDRVFDNQREN